MIVMSPDQALALLERGARACYERFNANLPEPRWEDLPPDFRQRLIDAFRAGLEVMR
jgi:hypothetical protein